MGVWFTSAVTGFMTVNTLGVLLPSISADLGLSPSQQGMLGSASFWGNLVLAIPISWWASRYRPKLLTAATLVLGTIFLFMQGFAPAFIVLILGRLAFGITILAREPARALLIRQWFSANEAVVANSISNVLFGIVVGGGLILTPIILDNLANEWRTIFYIFGGIFAALTVIWMILGRERPDQEPPRPTGAIERNLIKSTLSYRDIWIAGLGFAGASVSWAAFLNFYPTLMLNEYEIPLRWSGAILALGIFMGGVSGLIAGYHISVRGGRRRLLQAFGVIMVGSYLGLILTDSIPLLLLFTTLNGIAWGFFPILYSVPFVLPGIRSREVAIGVSFLTVALSTGSILGSLSAGFLQEALGDLQLTLLILSFSGLSLTIAGLLLRIDESRVITPASSSPQPASEANV
jgi:MFS family permease